MVTLKDIARECGVSSATVSYVVNGGPRSVLPETRQRVLMAVDKLGYRPNAAARSLMGKRTHTFGVVFPHVVASPFDNQYFAAVLTGIIDAATEQKQIAMLFTGLSWQEAERNVPLFCDGRCDGFIFVAPPPKSQLAQVLVDRKTPLVLLGTRALGVPVSTIDVDNVAASKFATRHLLNLGHRRIGMYHSDRPSSSVPERIQGFREAVLESGIPESQAPIFSFDHQQTKPYDLGSAYEAAYRFLNTPQGKELTAIVCAQDSTAMFTIRAAEALGRRVPQDLSVIGFDDLPLAARHDPAITSIGQPLRQIGASAVSTLLDLIDGEASGPTEKLFDVHLMERASTAPLRRSS